MWGIRSDFAEKFYDGFDPKGPMGAGTNRGNLLNLLLSIINVINWSWPNFVKNILGGRGTYFE